MKTFICLFVLTVIGISGVAQTISYGYDDAGNRTSRTITMNTSSAKMPIDTTQVASVPLLEEQEEELETPYKDMIGEQEIKVFPNPTRGELKVTFNFLQPDVSTKLRVYNVAGTQLLNLESLSTNNRIDLSSQKPGIYLMHIFVGEKSFEWKIIKK